MNRSIEKRQQGSTAEHMRYLEDTNIAPSAPTGGESSLGSGVSFRVRRRTTALGLLNRGLANWYPGTSDDLLGKDEDEQVDFNRKMDVLMKNSHVFEKFKDRVAASESFSNPMAARMVLEEFMQKDLLFVGKQGVIYRHSELIKHLVLTQRSPGGNAPFVSSASSSSSPNKMPFQKSSEETNLRQSVAETTQCDSLTATESSDSSFSEDFSNSPPWSPASGEKTLTFSGMPIVSPTLQVPMLQEDMDEQVFETFVN